MPSIRRRWGSVGSVLVGSCFLAASLAAAAKPPAAPAASKPPLPEEEIKVERLAPPDGFRLYVADPAFPHMADGRMHILDGRSQRYLGMLSTGFGALSTVTPDKKSILVVTTYHAKLSRGPRTDVVEVHDTETLELKAEIDIPPKRAQAIPYRSMLATSPDSRFLYIQNATPATSVSVVDLQEKKFIGEIQTPGCWSIHPWADGTRFSTICGDGTLQTIKLDESGKYVSRSRSAKFFDPDQDPIFVQPETWGEQRYFVSFNSTIYPVRLTGEEPSFDKPWSLLDAKDKKQGWRPGGYQMLAVHRASGVMFVGMHDHGYEGSHKNPAKEIWAVDLATKKRIARLPGSSAVALVAGQGSDARLFALDGEKNAVQMRAIKPGYPKAGRIEGIGETPMVMEVN